jgi:hypothetical protein
MPPFIQFRRPLQPILSGCLLTLVTLTTPTLAQDTPVSWFKDITPLFKRSCNGCHNPNKTKGESWRAI